MAKPEGESRCEFGGLLRFVESDGLQHKRRGCPDARENRGEAPPPHLKGGMGDAPRCAARGLIDPRPFGFRDHEAHAAPWTDHLADFPPSTRPRGQKGNRKNTTA